MYIYIYIYICSFHYIPSTYFIFTACAFNITAMPRQTTYRCHNACKARVIEIDRMLSVSIRLSTVKIS